MRSQGLTDNFTEVIEIKHKCSHTMAHAKTLQLRNCFGGLLCNRKDHELHTKMYKRKLTCPFYAVEQLQIQCSVQLENCQYRICTKAGKFEKKNNKQTLMAFSRTDRICSQYVSKHDFV
jgi:hypothetical protein